MSETIKVGVIGDFNAQLRSHVATNTALQHAAEHLSLKLKVDWLPTESFLASEAIEWPERYHGLWASAGSPYRSMEGALRAIRFAREENTPFLAT